MRHLRTHIHPDLGNLKKLTCFERVATRSICLRENDILLLFTERYQDYSLPGGGVDPGETVLEAFVRELNEETGATNVTNIKEFGIYEEFRPWYKKDYDIVHMISHCYTCDVDQNLSETTYEPYEEKNGMKALWVDLDSAISHNKKTIKSNNKLALSIERETFILELVKKELR